MVQAFGGVFIPAVASGLSRFDGTWVEMPAFVWSIFTPSLFCSAIAAVICAVWNLVIEKMGEK